MKTGVYQTNISHPGKATEGGWDILFAEGLTWEEKTTLWNEHWLDWCAEGKEGRYVWIRPLDIRQPWTDKGDGTFTLVEPASLPDSEPDPEPYSRDEPEVPPTEIP